MYFNLNARPGLYFFTLNQDERHRRLLHEITHMRTIADLEDSANDVWKTGPFYEGFIGNKDPLQAWGLDLRKNIKAKTGEACCPKPAWPNSSPSH